MKITCPACNANYRLPDEKIQGKNRIFKIACKRCGVEIRVRGVETQEEVGRTTMPFALDLPMPQATPAVATPVWFAGIDGKQVGPMTEAEVAEHIKEGRLSAQDLVWRKGFAAWLPTREVPPFDEMVADTAAAGASKPEKRAPRRAQTLELSAAMIELLVKLDGQSDASSEPPAQPVVIEPPQLPAFEDEVATTLLAQPAVDRQPAAVAAKAKVERSESAAAPAKTVAETAAQAAAEPAIDTTLIMDVVAPKPTVTADIAPVLPPKSVSGTHPKSVDAKTSRPSQPAIRISVPEETGAARKAADVAATAARPASSAVPLKPASTAVRPLSTATKAVTSPAERAAAERKAATASGAKPIESKGNRMYALMAGGIVLLGVAVAAIVMLGKSTPPAPDAEPAAVAAAALPAPAPAAAAPVPEVVPTPAPVAPAVAVAPDAGPDSAPAVTEPALPVPVAPEAVAVAPAAQADKVAKPEADAAVAKAATAAAKAAEAKTNAEAEAKAEAAKAQAREKAKEQADAHADAKQKAQAKAQSEAQAKEQAKQEAADRAEAKRKAKEEAAQSKLDAKQKAKDEAAAKARADADAKQRAKEEAAAKAAAKPAKGGGEDDELDRILAAQKAKAEGKRPGAKTEDDADAGGGAGLSQAEVNSVASRANQKVMKCYMLHGDVDAGEETIKVTLYVNGDGSVGVAKATGKHASDAVGSCVIKEVKALTFPQSSGPAKKYTVKYTVGM